MAEHYKVFRANNQSEIAQGMNEAAGEGYTLRDFQVRIMPDAVVAGTRGSTVHEGYELYVAVMIRVTPSEPL